MNKRSAIAVALGLVAALAIGGFAIATGLTGPETSQASPLVTKAKRQEPIVRTVTKTVTIHKKAEAEPAPVIHVASSSSNDSSGPSTTGTTEGATSSGYQDEVESEGDDHGSEDDDHGSEDDGSESEDHATEDHASEDESDDD
jgi:hypothetical protein